MDHTEELIERIRSAKGYREIVSIRDTVWGLSGKIALSDFLELRDRVEKKMNDIESPVFEDTSIDIVMADGVRTTLDPRSVAIVMGKGLKISSYVFSEYPGAVDFELKPSGFLEKPDPFANDPSYKLELNNTSFPTGKTVREGIVRIVKLALKLITFLFNAYARSFPHLADDLRILKESIEVLFEKVSSPLY